MTCKKLFSLILALCLLALPFGCMAEADDAADTDTYWEGKLFDTSYVHTIDVEIEAEDWADLKQNPLDKTKYKVNVTIDGETFEEVSFATKGNTSLSSVAQNADSDRYSFKLNFKKFNKKQSYYGLNKINLNNIYADATYMKDYISYEILREAGVESPLVSYVWLTINGEAHGLYIAIEDIGSSYLNRTRDGEGVLYKPETEQLANMNDFGGDFEPDMQDFTPQMPFGDSGNMPQMPNGGGGDMPQTPFGNNENAPQMPTDNDESAPQMPSGESDSMPQMPFGGNNMPQMPSGGNENQPQMPFGGGFGNIGGFGSFDPSGMDFDGTDFGDFGFGSSNSGANLKYTDDEISSYSDIFDNAETDAEDEDMLRVIAALKALSEGENLENYLFTDEIIAYFVGHNFVLNYDSYTGNMLHNYYLYECDGRLSMLPWDYNLAFGAFSGANQTENSATELINTGIDSPLSVASAEDRPMWAWIVNSEEYLEKYHECYDTLLTSYIESGILDAEIDRVAEMISPYVQIDPTAFYDYDEFTAAAKTLKQVITLRAKSIRKQLNGELATITSVQTEGA